MEPTDARESIESMNAPLAFRSRAIDLEAPARAGEVAFTAVTRALTGMQKEAYVARSGMDTVWRLVCDEGPYLNGTDLAPPPLAFFSAGMASGYADAILAAAAAADTALTQLEIVLDSRYSMEGSAVQGTMVAGALPVELTVSAARVDGAAGLADLAFEGAARSPLDALMRDRLTDRFSITHNGNAVATGGVAPADGPVPPNPLELFGAAVYDESCQAVLDAVSKIEATASVFEADHGAGAALKDSQKRELHIRSVLRIRDDGLREIRVQIFKPIGSVFRFLADATLGEGRAPCALTYVSAGIAFCFMTQLGRYAGIVRKDLSSYGIVQDTSFDLADARTRPVVTHAFLETSETDDTARKYVDMGEQTCFLHGACRMSNKTRIRVRAPAADG